MSWQDQGRQEHGWFGSGAAPEADKEGGSPDAGLFEPGGLDQRIQAVIHGAVGSFPASARKHAAAQPNTAALERLTGLIKVWGRGTRMDMASFAEHFFGRSARDPVAARLHDAAMTANLAQSHAELREAADDLTAAQQMVGLDRWNAFLVDAAQRASDPATIAALEANERPPDPRKDAITPVYPLEAVLGIGAVGLAKGAAVGLRAAGGAILRQMKPSGPNRDVDLLPKASKVRMPPEKVTEYALNPSNLKGGDKARVFESALGFNRGNVAGLVSQIRIGVIRNRAILGRADEYGQRYIVDIPVTGPKGSAVVRTGWIIDPGGTTPRLVTLFVK